MRRPQNPRATGGGVGETEEAFTIERGIEAIDRLRAQMREAGMTDCADALDEVYVQCLRDYVTRAAQKSMKRGNGILN